MSDPVIITLKLTPGQASALQSMVGSAIASLPHRRDLWRYDPARLEIWNERDAALQALDRALAAALPP